MKTIEGEIYEAFAKAGAILQANAVDPGKVDANEMHGLSTEQFPTRRTHRQRRPRRGQYHISQTNDWR